MPLDIVRNDITKMEVDAIVNAANTTLMGGGGVDGCIHRAAGPKLLIECAKLRGCPTGSAKLTGAYRLPCKYIIHAVGPRWHGGNCNEEALLTSCYKAALQLAKEHNCSSVAFPLISSGAYGYPKDRALKVAIDTIGEFLLENDMDVYIVIFDKNAYRISEKLFADIKEYIDDNYVDKHTDVRIDAMRARSMPRYSCNMPSSDEAAYTECAECTVGPDMPFEAMTAQQSAKPMVKAFSMPNITALSLDDKLNQLDESFSEMLLRKIDESGMTDAECYKKANIDRKLFSKIRSDKLYKPSKPTVIAFAIALELPIEEVNDMLMKAGFALSHSNKSDIIIEYFIEHGNYNIFEINEALFAFDQSLIGA